MRKKRATFNLSVELLERLDNLPRNILPNKSHLVEKLLEKWIDEQEKGNVGEGQLQSGDK